MDLCYNKDYSYKIWYIDFYKPYPTVEYFNYEIPHLHSIIIDLFRFLSHTIKLIPVLAYYITVF